jgi:hypothetical protein
LKSGGAGLVHLFMSTPQTHDGARNDNDGQTPTYARPAVGPGAGGGPHTPGPGPAHPGAFPPAISGWHVRQIPAGVWLSRRAGPVPPAVLALAGEPERVSVVVDSEHPDEHTDQALGELFPTLPAAGLAAVRLLLPSGAGRYGPAASRAYGLDVIAVDGPLTVTPHGYALATPQHAADGGHQPQWWRYRPAGEIVPAGLMSPSPAWDRELAAGAPERAASGVAVHRVPAGLALHLPGASAGQIAAARAVWPDPDRMTIVVGGTGAENDVLLDAVAGLLFMLPEAAAHSVRLWWPRAGADAASQALHEVARRHRAELIAPSAEVSVVEGSCGLCHGPAGGAPWIRFTGDPPGQPMGSLYPVPGWQRALDQADLTGLAPGLTAERVTAGLCVYRRESGQHERASRGLAATARSIIPDPAQATIIAAGDADSPPARQDLEAVLERLPAQATRRLRLVLSGAGAGGDRSYAQTLADTTGSLIIAPAGAWTATPDGRLRAIPAGRPEAADSWPRFFPRHRPVPLSEAAGRGGAEAQSAGEAYPTQQAAGQRGDQGGS